MACAAVACGDSQDDDPAGAQAGAGGTGSGGEGGQAGSGSIATTTVSGVVTDEDASPIAGAQVAAFGNTTTTDANGAFTLPSVQVPGGRLVVSVTKPGYFKAFRAADAIDAGTTYVKLSMMSLGTMTQLDAASGGRVDTDNGAAVELAANGFAQAGSPFTGAVTVAARHLSPDSAGFYNFFSGNFDGLRTDGNMSVLVSYGVLRVALQDDAGEPIELSSGTQATLRYPVPASLQASAPDIMPLWHFDETLGMWKEEGQAVLQDGQYVGTVSHFTDWNADVPEEAAYVKGRILCGGQPFEPTFAKLGQVEVSTDAGGNFGRRVPANTAFEARAVSGLASLVSNEPLYLGPPVSVPALEPGQTLDLGELPVDPSHCPAFITGTIVNPSKSPVAGTANAFWDDGFNFKYTAAGTFRLAVSANKSVTASAATIEGCLSKQVAVEPIPPAQEFNVGKLVVCEDEQTGFGDVTDKETAPFGTVYELSADGTMVAFAASRRETINVVNVKTNTLVSTMMDVLSGTNCNSILELESSADSKRLIVDAGCDSDLRVYDIATGELVIALPSVHEASFMPGADAILAQDYRDSTIKAAAIIDLNSGTVTQQFGITPNSYMDYKLLGLDDSATKFVAMDVDNYGEPVLRVWDMTSDLELLTKPLGSPAEFVALSSDASVIAIRQGSALQFLRTSDGTAVNATPLPEPQRWTIGISPDTNTFAAQYGESNTPSAPGLFSTSTGQPTKMLAGEANTRYQYFRFSRDGKTVSALEDTPWGDPTVRVWSIPE